MPLFYRFRHPIYQEIEYKDLSNRSSYPDEVLELLNNNMSFTTTLRLNHEGGDFCLESKIKKHKMIAPKGPVSNETWMRISRGLDKIDSIYKSAAAKLDLFHEDRYRQPDIYDEIVSWRAVLRSSGMLSNFEEEGFVKNIYGEPISLYLDGFTENLEEKMETY